jgi:ANTAR domain
MWRKRLMNREGLTDEQAFVLLVSTAQKASIKIHDLAAWLVDENNNNTKRGIQVVLELEPRVG